VNRYTPESRSGIKYDTKKARNKEKEKFRERFGLHFCQTVGWDFMSQFGDYVWLWHKRGNVHEKKK